MKKYIDLILISLISVALTLSLVNRNNHLCNSKIIDGGTPFCNDVDGNCQLSTNDIANMYSSYIEQWKQQISNAFNEAEVKIFNVKPTPDVVIPLEDPDPKKCICKGSGVIIHGDGHKTPCQYHGKTFNRMQSTLEEKDLIFKPLIILEK